MREQFRRLRGSGVFEVWPENWRAFEIFQACETQWTVLVAGLEGVRWWEGIDYERLQSVIELLPPEPGTQVPPPRQLFRQIQLLERAAKDALNSMRGR